MKLYNPIKRWWSKLDDFDQEIARYVFKVTVAAVIIVAVFMLIVFKVFEIYDSYKASQPCSYFENWTLDNVPVRCLADYGITIIHD